MNCTILFKTYYHSLIQNDSKIVIELCYLVKVIYVIS